MLRVKSLPLCLVRCFDLAKWMFCNWSNSQRALADLETINSTSLFPHLFTTDHKKVSSLPFCYSVLQSSSAALFTCAVWPTLAMQTHRSFTALNRFSKCWNSFVILLWILWEMSSLTTYVHLWPTLNPNNNSHSNIYPGKTCTFLIFCCVFIYHLLPWNFHYCIRDELLLFVLLHT